MLSPGLLRSMGQQGRCLFQRRLKDATLMIAACDGTALKLEVAPAQMLLGLGPQAAQNPSEGTLPYVVASFAAAPKLQEAKQLIRKYAHDSAE